MISRPFDPDRDPRDALMSAAVARSVLRGWETRAGQTLDRITEQLGTRHPDRDDNPLGALCQVARDLALAASLSRGGPSRYPTLLPQSIGPRSLPRDLPPDAIPERHSAAAMIAGWAGFGIVLCILAALVLATCH